MAAELTGRVCCGLELDAKYVDVIIGRWQKVTGQEAKLDGTGATFQEVQSGRRQPADKRRGSEYRESLRREGRVSSDINEIEKYCEADCRAGRGPIAAI